MHFYFLVQYPTKSVKTCMRIVIIYQLIVHVLGHCKNKKKIINIVHIPMLYLLLDKLKF